MAATFFAAGALRKAHDREQRCSTAAGAVKLHTMQQYGPRPVSIRMLRDAKVVGDGVVSLSGLHCSQVIVLGTIVEVSYNDNDHAQQPLLRPSHSKSKPSSLPDCTLKLSDGTGLIVVEVFYGKTLLRHMDGGNRKGLLDDTDAEADPMIGFLSALCDDELRDEFDEDGCSVELKNFAPHSDTGQPLVGGVSRRLAVGDTVRCVGPIAMLSSNGKLDGRGGTSSKKRPRSDRRPLFNNNSSSMMDEDPEGFWVTGVRAYTHSACTVVECLTEVTYHWLSVIEAHCRARAKSQRSTTGLLISSLHEEPQYGSLEGAAAADREPQPSCAEGAAFASLEGQQTPNHSKSYHKAISDSLEWNGRTEQNGGGGLSFSDNRRTSSSLTVPVEPPAHHPRSVVHEDDERSSGASSSQPPLSNGTTTTTFHSRECPPLKEALPLRDAPAPTRVTTPVVVATAATRRSLLGPLLLQPTASEVVNGFSHDNTSDPFLLQSPSFGVEVDPLSNQKLNGRETVSSQRSTFDARRPQHGNVSSNDFAVRFLERERNRHCADASLILPGASVEGDPYRFRGFDHNTCEDSRSVPMSFSPGGCSSSSAASFSRSSSLPWNPAEPVSYVDSPVPASARTAFTTSSSSALLFPNATQNLLFRDGPNGGFEYPAPSPAAAAAGLPARSLSAFPLTPVAGWLPQTSSSLFGVSEPSPTQNMSWGPRSSTLFATTQGQSLPPPGPSLRSVLPRTVADVVFGGPPTTRRRSLFTQQGVTPSSVALPFRSAHPPQHGYWPPLDGGHHVDVNNVGGGAAHSILLLTPAGRVASPSSSSVFSHHYSSPWPPLDGCEQQQLQLHHPPRPFLHHHAQQQGPSSSQQFYPSHPIVTAHGPPPPPSSSPSVVTSFRHPFLPLPSSHSTPCSGGWSSSSAGPPVTAAYDSRQSSGPHQGLFRNDEPPPPPVVNRPSAPPSPQPQPQPAQNRFAPGRPTTTPPSSAAAAAPELPPTPTPPPLQEEEPPISDLITATVEDVIQSLITGRSADPLQVAQACADAKRGFTMEELFDRVAERLGCMEAPIVLQRTQFSQIVQRMLNFGDVSLSVEERDGTFLEIVRS